MILRAPTLEECELVRQWRNAPDVLPMLRTKTPLTKEQQEAFYRDVVCNPASNHRYYALEYLWRAEPPNSGFIGLGGLTYLDRVPGEGEISLILGPDFRRRGFGTQAVHDLRRKGFELGLRWIVGECYDANPARNFWVRTVVRLDGSIRYEPDRFFFRFRAL